jgi:hypothetical protein
MGTIARLELSLTNSSVIFRYQTSAAATEFLGGQCRSRPGTKGCNQEPTRPCQEGSRTPDSNSSGPNIAAFESASRPLVDFDVLNDNLIKRLISCVKYMNKF